MFSNNKYTMQNTGYQEFFQKYLPIMGYSWQGFRKVKKQLFKRLSERLRKLGLEYIDQYEEYITQNKFELKKLDDLTYITISRFYRDREVFETVKNHILPEISAKAKLEQRVPSVWSAGSCSGEEPYTISLIWNMDIMNNKKSDFTIRIIASEKNSELIQRSRAACYNGSSLKDLPEIYINECFIYKDDKYFLKNIYKEGVGFVEQDIRTEMPDGIFDLILCRYLVFTYFSVEKQVDLLRMIVKRLRKGGYLITGTHEKIPIIDHGLLEFNKCIYIKC